MNALLITAAALTFAAEPAARPAPDAMKLDGSWTVVAVEKNGQAVPDAKNMTVTVKDNTITCAGKDGKDSMTFRLEFGPNGTLKATEAASSTTGGDKPAAEKAAPDDKQGPKHGVFVLTQDYFAVCLHGDAARGGDAPRTEGRTSDDKNAPAAGDKSAGASGGKSYCSIILKREGGARSTERRDNDRRDNDK